MSLEATLIMLDNSASSINGDYEPTRWESQSMCAELLIQAKLQANQQSSVGVGLMGGKQVQVLCTLTGDQTKASSYLFGVKSSGELHFAQAIQIGALSLKHRSNQTQKPRMICFVGSTIKEDVETLKILAKKLKKNAVAVDVVCFGDCSEEQVNKVQTFVNTVQNQDNSHCLVVEPGQIISDNLIASPIVGGGAGGMGPGGAGGLDNLQAQDPELAAAIRASLQQANGGAPQQAPPQPQPSVVPQPQPSSQPQPEANYHEPTDEQLQQLAIQMSLQQFNLQEAKEQKQKQAEKKEEEKPQEGQKKE